MTNTIIKINHKKYSENVIVNWKNLEQVRELVKGKQWSVAVQGEFTFTETYEMIHHELGLEKMPLVVKDGKFKYQGDTCESYTPRYQKAKETKNGRFLVIHGQRWYFFGA